MTYPRRLLYSRTLLFIHSKCDGLHLLTPHSQSVPLPTPSPLATASLFSMSVSLLLFCRYFLSTEFLEVQLSFSAVEW